MYVLFKYKNGKRSKKHVYYRTNRPGTGIYPEKYGN